MFEEMFGSVFVGSLAALALAGLLLALGAWAIPKLRNEKQGYPHEDTIEKLVLPYAARAVMLAYEMAERAFEETGEVMAGVDKKAFADGTYRYMPSQVKNLVTPEQWRDLTQRAYDDGRNLLLQCWAGLKKDAERWKGANVPAADAVDPAA